MGAQSSSFHSSTYTYDMPVSPYALETVQEQPSNNGGRNDTRFGAPHFGTLGDSTGSGNLSIPGNHPMEPVNSAGDYCDSLCDSPTEMLAPASTNNIPNRENSSAFHALPRSVPQPGCTHLIASGTPPSVSHPPVDTVDASDGLIKPRPLGYKTVQDDNTQKWAQMLSGLGLRSSQIIYYLRNPSTKLYQCSVGQCTEAFQADSIHNHLITKHRRIARHQKVTCKECHRTMKAKSYEEHFLDRHSGRGFCCAYCNRTPSRMRVFLRHLKKCPGLTEFLETRKVMNATG